MMVEVAPAAAGATGVAGVVFQVDAGIAGAEIGEFTGAAFEASTVGSGADERAVLKVPLVEFGGGNLAVNDAVRVFVRNSTHATEIVDATIIEE